MRQSLLITKTRKEAPSDEEAKNAKILIRAGYVNKNMAGVYEFLPLGFRSLQKIIQIIREEMNGIGGQELFLSALQNPGPWKETGRWDDEKASEVWFYTKLNVGGDLGLGWTHEEPITSALKHHINSHKDLPKYAYQIQSKFRNEKRSKSGILRTREFIMKDLYSFCKNKEEHDIFYEECAKAYMRIFEKVGIGEHTHRTFASGGAFSDFSDEFQVILPEGEDIIYVDKVTGLAINKEVFNQDTLKKLDKREDEFEQYSSSEVGNIFTLGTRFSETLGLKYTDEDGKEKPVFMGSYGVGPGRLLGILVEMFSNEKGMILPSSVAPYTVHLLSLGDGDDVLEIAENVYETLQKAGIEVLFDDRKLSAGEKFSDSDLIGIPNRLIVSNKTILENKVEYLDRRTSDSSLVEFGEILNLIN